MLYSASRTIATTPAPFDFGLVQCIGPAANAKRAPLLALQFPCKLSEVLTLFSCMDPRKQLTEPPLECYRLDEMEQTRARVPLISYL